MHSLLHTITLVLLMFIVLSSCEKVINVKLDRTAARYVVAGYITDQPGVCQVSLTRTKDFNGNNTFPGVSGATVTIENDGVITPLREKDSGLYTTTTLTGKPGTTYHLTVNIQGQVFKASSTMPQLVQLDSIFVSNGTFSTKKMVTVVYKDPPHIPNYYRFIQYVNGKKERTVFAVNDEFSDGITVKNQLDYNNDTNDSTRDITSGKTVTIDMLCIDSAVYKYWFSVVDAGATGRGNTASPSNPVSNITGGPALGYFSAHTVRSKTIKVP